MTSSFIRGGLGRAAAVTLSPGLARRLPPPGTPPPETQCREMGLSRVRPEEALGKRRTGGLLRPGCPRRGTRGSRHGGSSLSGAHPKSRRALPAPRVHSGGSPPTGHRVIPTRGHATDGSVRVQKPPILHTTQEECLPLNPQDGCLCNLHLHPARHGPA